MSGETWTLKALAKDIDFASEIYRGAWPIAAVYHNAREEAVLAAAAPDLLNACKAALPLVASHPHESGHKRLQVLEAAIAKAEGRS